MDGRLLMFALHVVILVLLVGIVLVAVLAGRRIRRSEQRAQSDAVTGILNSILSALGVSGWLYGLVMDGIVAGVGAVLGFLFVKIGIG